MLWILTFPITRFWDDSIIHRLDVILPDVSYGKKEHSPQSISGWVLAAIQSLGPPCSPGSLRTRITRLSRPCNTAVLRKESLWPPTKTQEGPYGPRREGGWEDTWKLSTFSPNAEPIARSSCEAATKDRGWGSQRDGRDVGAQRALVEVHCVQESGEGSVWPSELGLDFKLGSLICCVTLENVFIFLSFSFFKIISK